MDKKNLSNNSKYLMIGEEEYEVIPSHIVAASKIISDMYNKLGKPKDPFTETGKKMMEILIAVWQDLDPYESKKWFDNRKEYQDNEMGMTEQVEQRTGRSLASIPYPIHEVMKKLFPEFDTSNREHYLKLVKHYPMFRMANKA